MKHNKRKSLKNYYHMKNKKSFKGIIIKIFNIAYSILINFH